MTDPQDHLKPLSAKQAAFVAAYIGGARFNGTKAAIMAGYSEKSARTIASENLPKPNILARVNEELTARAMPAEAVLAELTEVATAPWGMLTEVLVYDDDGQPLKTRMDLGSKVKALELLGKHHQLFSDNLNISGGIEIREYVGIPEDEP
jgi:phage terminase small subunit